MGSVFTRTLAFIIKAMSKYPTPHKTNGAKSAESFAIIPPNKEPSSEAIAIKLKFKESLVKEWFYLL